MTQNINTLVMQMWGFLICHTRDHNVFRYCKGTKCKNVRNYVLTRMKCLFFGQKNHPFLRRVTSSNFRFVFGIYLARIWSGCLWTILITRQGFFVNLSRSLWKSILNFKVWKKTFLRFFLRRLFVQHSKIKTYIKI